MRRRELLTVAGGLVGTTALAPVSGRASGAEPYARLGRVHVDGAAEAVVGDGGTTAYVAADDGFATVDVSDPTSPTVLAERRELLADRENGPMGGIKDVKVDGDRLLVVGPANSDDSVFNGAALFDVSDPADPQLLRSHRTPNSVHNGFLDGEVAYLTAGKGGQKLAVVDVSADGAGQLTTWDPTDHDDAWTNVSVGQRTVHDVFVQGDRAYLATWNAGTFVLDVSDPADPTYLARVSDYTRDEVADLGRLDRFVPPGNHHYARVSEDGSLLAVGREAWDLSGYDGGPGGITLYDLSTPSEPTELATVDPVRARDETIRSGIWTTSHNFDLVGDRLYSSWYQAGVKIHDVSDPSNPELLAWWRNPEETVFWTAQRAAGDALVASSHAIGNGPDWYEGLYTFPDRAGEQADPQRIPSPTPKPTSTPTATSTNTPPASADGATPTPTDTPTDTPTPTTTPQSAAGDGFGALAALAALGGVAWWRRRE
jgi:MYXO-CTERM domain-containing protein